MSNKLKKVALLYKLAEDQYDAAFNKYYDELNPLHIYKFADLVAVYRGLIFKAVLHKREKPTEYAADEFFRQALVGEAKYTLEEATSFAKSYQYYSSVYSKECDRLPFSFDRGDDGFSDLMDNLPLLRKNFSDKVHAGEINSLDEFNAAIINELDALNAPDGFSKFILSGENYNRLHLFDAAKSAYANNIYYNMKEI